MNRTIFLARPEPSEEDLIKTAYEICDSYKEGAHNSNSNLLKALVKSYVELR